MKKRRSLEKRLEYIARKLGFRQVSDYPISKEEHERGVIGLIDYVWLKDIPLVGEVPIVGFEKETSWRTSKHLKGDIYNLLCLDSSVGVILFIKTGFYASDLRGHIDSVKRYAKIFSPNSRILAWTEKDIEELEKAV
jgi:hypothetical protein